MRRGISSARLQQTEPRRKEKKNMGTHGRGLGSKLVPSALTVTHRKRLSFRDLGQSHCC